MCECMALDVVPTLTSASEFEPPWSVDASVLIWYGPGFGRNEPILNAHIE